MRENFQKSVKISTLFLVSKGVFKMHFKLFEAILIMFNVCFAC